MEIFNQTEKSRVSTKNLKNLIAKEDVFMDINKTKNEVNSKATSEMLDELVNQANEQREQSNLTSEFSASAADEAISGTDAEKAKKKALKEDEILKRNKIIDAQRASLIHKEAGKISPALTAFQALCRHNFVLEALIYENGPKAKINVSRSVNKDKDGNFTFFDGVSTQDQERVKLESKVNKYQYCKSTSKLTYGLGAPTGLVGGVITMPKALNVMLYQLTTPDFTPPTKEAVEASEKITMVVDFDLLFTYIYAYCGGEINESELVKNNPMYVQNPNPITAYYDLKTKRDKSTLGYTEDGGRAKVTTKKRKLALKQNVIPIKVHTVKDLANITEEDKENLTKFLTKRFDTQKDGTVEDTYSVLDANQKDLVNRAADGSYDFRFLSNPALLKQKNLVAYDWGTCKYEEGKAKQVELSITPSPVYVKSVSKDGKVSYKVEYATLGGEYTLDKIAADFPAASLVASKGITADAIKRVYSDYKASKAATGTTAKQKSVKRASTALTAEEGAVAFLKSVAEQNQMFDGINSARLYKAITDQALA